MHISHLQIRGASLHFADGCAIQYWEVFPVDEVFAANQSCNSHCRRQITGEPHQDDVFHQKIPCPTILMGSKPLSNTFVSSLYKSGNETGGPKAKIINSIRTVRQLQNKIFRINAFSPHYHQIFIVPFNSSWVHRSVDTSIRSIWSGLVSGFRSYLQTTGTWSLVKMGFLYLC